MITRLQSRYNVLGKSLRPLLIDHEMATYMDDLGDQNCDVFSNEAFVKRASARSEGTCGCIDLRHQLVHKSGDLGRILAGRSYSLVNTCLAILHGPTHISEGELHSLGSEESSKE